MTIKTRTWITFGDDVKFGDGRARLLELIAARGSLSKAAEELEMSYRNAWGYLQDLERAAGFKFVERAPGRGPQSGMRVTAEGLAFLARYQAFRRAVEATVDRQFARAFARTSPRRPRARSAPR
ncbi:MAG: LysR family transcriptional regulator [Candidatus Rokubacteria bacterium]|nr:LysR family transcriptional regulator [Candidatus Rokubacteria bacterium]